MRTSISVITLIAIVSPCVNTFLLTYSPTHHHHHHHQIPSSLFMTATESPPSETPSKDEDASNGLLRRDRYVATNRFSVRSNREAKFEKRWAVRKSRLATLDGFRYFHLMRRVKLNEDGTNEYDEGENKQDRMGNYVSFTIWEKKHHFSAWRSGEAFKEAHGGTSLGAFVSTMVSSALVLQGPPRPAFYDGLLTQSVKPDFVPELVDGWRSVEADGVNVLPKECFVAFNQFYIPRENAAQFEKRWADRDSKLKENDGFVTFVMLRRDVKVGGHGTVPMSDDEPTYVSATIWKDRASFDKWMANTSHSGVKKPLWSKPPSPVFYEGKLVITSEDGA